MADRQKARELIQEFVSHFAEEERAGRCGTVEGNPILEKAFKADPRCPELLALKSIKYALNGDRKLAMVGILVAFHELRDELAREVEDCEPRLRRDGE